ncbi:MAG TPA: extracellular solute-binding protein [Hyphomicrobiales bacterium]|nr:extracellular solute-binding protein [Hyphomicrobiales bacterium]
MGRRVVAVLLILLAMLAPATLLAASGPPAVAPRYAIAMQGEPALPLGFGHFPYVDPAAPQGGQLTFGIQGSFDSLNPFVVRGAPADGIPGNVVEPLMARSYDEPFALYGLLAQTVTTPPDRSWVAFGLDPRAHFSDGTPVTPADVVFSWKLLRDHGRPNFRAYYSKVKRAEILDRETVRFDFGGVADRELPLILGLMPVLPRHATDAAAFEQGGLKPLVGSGPYVVATVRPGESLILKRDPHYWGQGLPTTAGMNNAATLRYDYYRDANTLFDAFKRGLYDIRIETDPTRWTTGYGFPAVRDGRVIKETLPLGVPAGMNGLVFNTRRPLFADVRVREALGMLFDFEWIDQHFYDGVYTRTAGYFDGSDLSSIGRPASAAERQLLAPYPQAVRDDVMAGAWRPPRSDGSGRDRMLLRRALALLNDAGWRLAGGTLVNARSGQPFAFEILVETKEEERLALVYAHFLARAGIAARVRMIDDVQYQTRLQRFDFDMTQYFWFASLSPGNEQAFYWGSAAADSPGSRNYMGAKEPAIDACIRALVAARTRADLVTAARALDRVLISGFYVVPLFHAPGQWVARWNHVGLPARTPLYGPRFETWWRKDAH